MVQNNLCAIHFGRNQPAIVQSASITIAEKNITVMPSTNKSSEISLLLFEVAVKQQAFNLTLNEHGTFMETTVRLGCSLRSFL